MRVCEANSSPGHIIATKGSSVWLHWNYTYIGDGTHEGNVHIVTKFKEQIIGINSTRQPRFQAIAKRIGQYGTLALEAKVPAQFIGRVEVISSNSTLVIHDLQFSDSVYCFSSDVYVDIDMFAVVPVLNHFHLKPIVSLAVIGNFMSVELYQISLSKQFLEPPTYCLLALLSKGEYLSDLKPHSCFWNQRRMDKSLVLRAVV